MIGLFDVLILIAIEVDTNKVVGNNSDLKSNLPKF